MRSERPRKPRLASPVPKGRVCRVDAASDMKYERALRDELASEFDAPFDDFTRLLGKRVYSGNFTAGTCEKFKMLVRRAAAELVRDQVDGRLRGALQAAPETDGEPTEQEAEKNDPGIATTDVEIDGFKIVQAICAEFADPARIGMRDAKAYCAILFDDNNRKPIVRLRFNREHELKVEYFDLDQSETVAIDRPADIYRDRMRIRNAMAKYVDLPAEPASSPAIGTEEAGSSYSVVAG